MNLKFRLACYLEETAILMKERAIEKEQARFLCKYGLTDRPQEPRRVTKYNYYGGVNVLLLDKLLESGIVKTDDHILDVGCGTGMFLFYMAAHGFSYLMGQDLDRDLCGHAWKNKNAFLEHCPEYEGHLEIRCENAITAEFSDDINVCYLFNSFFDQETYQEWLAVVRASLDRAPRKMKIILLYPTPASLGAFRKCNWLKETGIISDPRQVCSLCVRFQIFEA